MIETIDARATIRRAPRGISSWHYSRTATGVVSHRFPLKVPGISLCTYSKTPDGEHRLRVEGNLTTLLHGEGAASMSLHADELDDAADALVGVASEVAGMQLPGRSEWDVHRLDPSRTLEVGQQVDDYLDATSRAWRRLRNPRQSVARYDGDGCSVRWQHAKWRSWEVYDKSAEVRARGGSAPVGLLRVEARVRPRKGSGDWKRAMPTLALDKETRRLVMGELDALTDTVIGKAAAVGLGALMLALVEEGVKPTTAVRLAGVVAVAEELGPKFFEDRLGVPAKTVERWRAEARRSLGSIGEDEDRLASVYRTVGMDLLAKDVPQVFARDRKKP